MFRLLQIIFMLALVIVIGLGAYGYYLTTLNADPVEKPARQMSEVWHNYPFTSHYIEVNGSTMHYIDEGGKDGPVVLLLHGNPTSSYLWRDVIPPIAASGARVIAVDNIGFGASDRPDIGYTFAEHSTYIDGFIEAMALEDITFVIHDWGSALGFDYAYRNPDNVAGIAFMEAIYGQPSMSDLPGFARRIFQGFRTPVTGELMVLSQNFFVEQVLPMSIIRELSEEEMDAYREPFQSTGSRLPTLVWPRQIPFDGSPADVAARVNMYSAWLEETQTPKVVFCFEPGALIDPEECRNIGETWPNTKAVFLGVGSHFVQEDHGPAIGAEVVKWVSERDGEPAE